MKKIKNKCPYCGVTLSGTLTGRNPSPKGLCCDDCYYEGLGKLIEEYPILKNLGKNLGKKV